MAIDYKEIGSNIKVCRIRKNLKQAQLAEIVGVSSQHISHIECGRTTVSLPLLISIAQALSVDLSVWASSKRMLPCVSFRNLCLGLGGFNSRAKICIKNGS